jgi:hypothetical protein
MIESLFDVSLEAGVKMELAQFDKIWTEAQQFRQQLAAMIVHGDLQFEGADLLCSYFGNIVAYTLDFMHNFLLQLKKTMVDIPRFFPQQPLHPVQVETSIQVRRSRWRNLGSEQKKEFSAY